MSSCSCSSFFQFFTGPARICDDLSARSGCHSNVTEIEACFLTFSFVYLLFRSFRVFRWFCFGRFGCFGRFVSVVLLVSLVSFRSFCLFRWFRFALVVSFPRPILLASFRLRLPHLWPWYPIQTSANLIVCSKFLLAFYSLSPPITWYKITQAGTHRGIVGLP